MKRTRQIMAIAGIVILVGLYVVTLILAIVNNEYTTRWFTAAIVATVVIPVLIYVYQWIYKSLKKSADEARTGSYIVPDEAEDIPDASDDKDDASGAE